MQHLETGRPTQVVLGSTQPALLEPFMTVLFRAQKRSSRKCCQSFNFRKSTLLRVHQDDLNNYPNELKMSPKLTTADKTKREAMAAKLLEKMEEIPSFLNLIWSSDLSPPPPRRLSLGLLEVQCVCQHAYDHF